MDTILKYEWQQAVLDALLELDPERLPEKIAITQRVIAARLHDPRQPDKHEQGALNDSLRLLHAIFPRECRNLEGAK